MTVVLDVANVVQDHTGEAIQIGELVGETQVTVGSQESLDQGSGARPQHRMTGQDEFVAHGSQGVTFPNPGTAHSNHIDGGLQKCSAPEPLELQLKGRGESCQVEGAKGLVLGKP